MVELVLGKSKFPFPALEPPDTLQFAYDSCIELQNLIDNGIVEYTSQGVAKWISTGTIKEQYMNRRKFDAIVSFLNGEKLSEAKKCFTQSYRKYLEESPDVTIALFIVKEQMQKGAVIEGLRPEAKEAIALL